MTTQMGSGYRKEAWLRLEQVIKTVEKQDFQKDTAKNLQLTTADFGSCATGIRQG